jgi:hypothetical protein
MSLLFSVADLLDELRSFSQLADDLLAGGSKQVLRTAADELTGLSRGVTTRRWQVRLDNPVLTMPSYGAYMPDDAGGLTVFAEITFAWDLEPVRPRGDTRPARQVRVDGLASTAIRVLSGTPYQRDKAEELAVWRMEIADRHAPGAFFHVQVLGRDADTVFPKSLDVPRLPGVLHSPCACMEFVLGELFQAQWPRIAMRESGPGHRWRSIQAHRHARHLAWVAREVASSSGSPWVMWKRAQPDEGLFLPA